MPTYRSAIGDKYTREQLIQSVLQPSSRIHPDYATTVVITHDGKTHTGVLRQRTKNELQLLDAEGKLVRIPLAKIDEQQRGKASLMPTDLSKTVTADQFADLIAYLATLKQRDDTSAGWIVANCNSADYPGGYVCYWCEFTRGEHRQLLFSARTVCGGSLSPCPQAGSFRGAASPAATG